MLDILNYFKIDRSKQTDFIWQEKTLEKRIEKLNIFYDELAETLKEEKRIDLEFLIKNN